MLLSLSLLFIITTKWNGYSVWPAMSYFIINKWLLTGLRKNELDAVKRLRVDDLFIVNNTGHTLIMWAVKQGSLDILEFLLNQTNFLQQTPGNEKAKKERPSLINAQAQKVGPIYGRS